MAIVSIYPGEPCILEVVFPSNPFLAYNKDYSDIQNVYMGLKLNPSDADDAYLAKYKKDPEDLQGDDTGDVFFTEEDHAFKIQLSEEDSFPLGNYFVAIGVKLDGLNKMIWLRQKRNNNNQVIVEGDGVEQ